ncbi:hypothetical protein HDU82_005761 [Entophlyctis luteolus]|nr:hypothetical protein HDU82_005761 [Entophlyctis luteolus]
MKHPYFPRHLSLPHYRPSHISMQYTLATLFSAIAVVQTVAWILISRKTKDRNTRLLFLWFVTCSGIHGVLEGYFAWTNRTIANDQTVLSAMWKEYAMSDSRYMSSDPFVVIMEGCTAALWGPLALLCAYLLYVGHPARYLAQLMLSMGQLYGLLLYYGTEIFDAFVHTSPAPLHYWVYFWGFNAPWFVVPALILANTGRTIVRACAAAQLQARTVPAKPAAAAAGKKQKLW